MDTHALPRHRITPFWMWVIAVGVCEVTGIVSGLIAREGMNTWFDTINKPAWNPPDWVFGPVWTFLYLLMGTALWLVWKSNADRVMLRKAFSLFGIQLFFNFCWSILFFNFQSPLLAFGDILLLLVAIIMTMVAFWPISRVAVWLFVPYLLWVCFATALNYKIWLLN